MERASSLHASLAWSVSVKPCLKTDFSACDLKEIFITTFVVVVVVHGFQAIGLQGW